PAACLAGSRASQPRRKIRWTLQAQRCDIGARRGRRAPLRIGFPMTKTLEESLSCIRDGCMLVVPREVSGVPMAATRALIRRGIRDLHLVALPTSSLQADLMIGARCVATLETSAVSLGEFGPAPRFSE